jgi:hypothetical protein
MAKKHPNIRKKGNVYQVRKQVKGRLYSGHFPTIKAAVEFRDSL